ncbi:hemin-degrading factor [Thalassospira mesophila]|uniref:Hemin transporter n=1 Tax=Thalassospira mesophila TaxID=1293891 RepID=A0A1Y2L569_9PROT|nr:ChuX/HutX family heme-like substrate-binding protein [Thalassospira mesophila]OSQ40955.1 hemin transporter [Thalassospira mesophila]
MTPNSTDIVNAWNGFATGTAKGYAVDIAKQLGVSEGELVAAGCGSTVTRIDANWGDVISRLEELGEVMVLTRNPSVVHEKTGTFGAVSIQGDMGLVLNGDVDLRLFLGHWGFGFAVEARGRRSLQFFGHDGTAIHKVFLTDHSSSAGFDALVTDFRAADQTAQISVLPPLPTPVTQVDEKVDVENWRAHWRNMTDVHQFHGLLNDFNLGRHQGLRLAGPEFAEPLDPATFQRLLEDTSASALPIMVFVGNAGAIQIHTGPINTIRVMENWVNVMDPRFTLHLRTDHLAEMWLVRKPIREGVITTIELYDADQNNFAILCGQRAPKEAESPAWQKLAEGMPRLAHPQSTPAGA